MATTLVTGTGAPSTFSSRIDVAYMVGQLPVPVRRDLHLIRRIRNDFAHSAFAVTFEQPAIRARCQELALAVMARTPRHRFLQSAMGIAGFTDGGIRKLRDGTSPRCIAEKQFESPKPRLVREMLRLIGMRLGPPGAFQREPDPSK